MGTSDNLENNVIRIETGMDKYRVHLTAICCGKDLNVSVTGGEISHIGAVSLAIYESERDSATVSTICAYGHRDDQLAIPCAKKIASALKCTVTVSVGIHIDNAAVEEIQTLKQNCMDCVAKLLDTMINGSE